MSDKDFWNQLITQAKSDFLNLRKKSWSEFKLIEDLYTLNDARCEIFVNYTALNTWLLIHLDTFLDITNLKNNKLEKYLKLDDSVKFNERQKLIYLRQHDMVNRTTYITKAMFDVEDFFNKIMLKVDPAYNPTKDESFWIVSRECLRVLNMGTEQNHKILNLPYKIRNTLHNNGFHQGRHDFEITLRGKPYEFVRGQQIFFADWDNLYIVFDELVSLLIEIVNSPVLQKIENIPQTSHLN